MKERTAVTATQQSFTSRTVPWAAVGAVIDDPDVDSQRAAELGGLDFNVVLARALYQVEGQPTRNVSTRRAMVREDDGTFFSYVSDGYKPVQYTEAFAFMDQINPRYVAAGTFSGGRQAFMVVQFPDHLTIDPMPGGESDPHDLYAVCRTSHDLSKAVEIAVLPLRNRCMNQLPLRSLTRGVQQRWSVRHVGDPKRKLQNAVDALTRTVRYGEVFEGMVRQLHSVPVDRNVVKDVLKRVLPDRPKRDEQIAAIVGAFESSPAVGFTGTAWGAVNAVSEYFEHGRPTGTRTAQARFTGGLSGDTRKYVDRTAQLMLNR
jgi:phage/plasmid-like protein (TIGR03299 family)